MNHENKCLGKEKRHAITLDYQLVQYHTATSPLACAVAAVTQMVAGRAGFRH